MATFHGFLSSRFELGGCSTEDALASFLPLAKQVAGAHAAGKVAPLDGVLALQVEGVKLWYPEADAKAPTLNSAKLRLLDRPVGALEVLSSRKRTTDVDDGPETLANLDIGTRDQEITKPVYLPGYVSWEHQIGHHDPVTDIFSLGMILASLVCTLDFNQPEDLHTLVTHRRNLFRINAQLHPVMAKAIVRMTELSRHQRLQDLTTLIHNLEHYRDQAVDLSFDLAHAEGTVGARKQVILGKLQERLFEVSRRNRLLHFQAPLQSVNLTHASVPLSFDVRSIRPDQIVTWNGEFAKLVSAGQPVSLTRHLNFSEQLYLPSVLDRLRAEAARDAAEYGFEQLRLAICFLRWANIKTTPPEQYDSPLVLLPVRLFKKKGVRDSYFLQPLTTEAEINPVVRHLFQEYYGIELPLTINLEESSIEQLYGDLAAKVNASEPGINVTKVDHPRIDLIHDLAKRRLDRYRRSARLSGRGVKSFLNVDYSYDPANFHPLGLAIFAARIRPTPTRLREIVQDTPTPRSYMAPPENDSPTSEKQRQFYALREQADDNPYHWEFDLCRLTLGNFRYRKMTLVRDYTELAANGIENPAFDAIFSLVPRPVETEAPAALPLEERYHIVACDPTQATAIGLARAGTSYIIQGPPGTGKSQTITNLIADYVMRGKKLLFVCEKRAAIDVVYARLRQVGLHQLCCLIHDSQTDKKEFIADLKATYEALVAEQQTKPKAWRRRRMNLIKSLQEELEPLAAFNQAMLATPTMAGLSVRELLERAIELAADMPQFSPVQKEILPDYVEWLNHTEPIEHLASALADLGRDGVLAQHPLRLLSPKVTTQERPTQWITSSLGTAQELLTSLLTGLNASGVPATYWQSLTDVLVLTQYAQQVEPLARRRLIGLLDDRSPLTKRFAQAAKELAILRTSLDQALEGTKHWRTKLPAEEVPSALEQAQALEGKLLSMFKPAWWRLRRVLRERYHFAAHAVRASWTHVLTALDKEYKAAAALKQAEATISAELGLVDKPATIAQDVRQTRASISKLSPTLIHLHTSLLTSERASETIASLVEAGKVAGKLESVFAGFVEGVADRPLGALSQDLKHIDESLAMLRDFLYCLVQLGQLPPKLASAFRILPVNARGLEAAILGRAIDELFRADQVLNRFNGSVRDAHVQRLAKLSQKWQDINAAAVLEKARQKFLENLRISALPAAGLTAEQKEFKAAYNRGRRELEHEFGKVMRHKSIRDLVAGDSGLVISDLKPIWLMSPLSVCDTLPLRIDQFDVVIFDEASQIALEEAVPAIFRASQAIVVGDEMQLPPTNFFSAKTDGTDEEGLLISDNGQTYEYDLASNSFLNHAAKNLASRMLGWHYRSRSESLISFSNWAFYQGKLLTVPEKQTAVTARPEILASCAADGQARVDDLLNRPVSFHFLSHGVYDDRRNSAEADYIANLVRGLLARDEHPSIGIVAFSEAQQSQIESALNRLAEEDEGFGDRLEAEYERQIDSQYVGLLIKNLENIQGDERDVVILSVCYANAPDGKMRMNFGPINQTGGERRLNVAFSRAKHHMAVVSSIRHTAITNDYNDGANCLKSYLRYAAACSVGDLAGSQRILRELALWHDVEEREETKINVVVQQIAAALTQRGYAVDTGVGMSRFRCDLAARRHGELGYRLGVLVDTQVHYEQTDLLERDMLRPQLMSSFGWHVAHVLMRDWYQDRTTVLGRLVHLIEEGPDSAAAEAPEDDDDDIWAEFDGPEDAGNATAPNGTDTAAGAQDASQPQQDGLTPVGLAPRHFEFTGGNSAKFWNVSVDGNAVTVRFGRIGTNGQTQTKRFADADTAARTARRLVAEKTAKGYKEKRV